MGYVYHSHFLVWFEIGRTDYFRMLGFTYVEMEQNGIYMPVVECASKFLVPARYDDELEVGTDLEMPSRIKLKFNYEVVRIRDSRLIAQGSTTHVPVNQEGRPCRLPAVYVEALQKGIKV